MDEKQPGWFGKLLAWLRLKDRPLGLVVAILSLAIAFFACVAGAFQAMLLYSQRATPYTTALYVRQLEVAGDYSGVAWAQWVRMVNLRNDCQARVDGDIVEGKADYFELAKEFRNGAHEFHEAYASAALTFPEEVRDSSNQAWTMHERMFDRIVAPSSDCRGFIRRFDAQDGEQTTEDFRTHSLAMLNGLHDKLRIARASWPQILDELPEGTSNGN